jgi:hypothetical protein
VLFPARAALTPLEQSVKLVMFLLESGFSWWLQRTIKAPFFMLARLKPLLSPQHIRNIIFTATTQNKEKTVKKIEADAVAIAMARDILRTNSSQFLRDINEYTAMDIAKFISRLSTELQTSMDGNLTSDDVFIAHKGQ